MSYDTITVTPSTPHVGAEIGNIDLTRPLSNRQVQEVHDAIIAHGVVFFRDQKIDFDSHERFVRYFGEPHIHVGGKGTASKGVPGHPAIRHQYFDANSKRVSGEEWHSDQSCAEIPPMYSVLYQEVVPPNGGGDTMFTSACKAYEELSPGMKTYLEGKTATHDGSRVFDKNADVYPVSVHPIVVRHAESGRKLLFVNREFTSHINEVPEGESRGVLEFLYDHIARPHWSMRFHWTDHSIA
jgi:taurine dioxygenase